MNIAEEIEKIYHSIPQDGDPAKVRKRIQEAKKYCKYYYPEIMTYVGDAYEQSGSRIMIVDLCRGLRGDDESLYLGVKDFYGYTDTRLAYSRMIGDGDELFSLNHCLNFLCLKREEVVYHSFILRPLKMSRVTSELFESNGEVSDDFFWDNTATKDYVEGLKVFFQVLEACRPKIVIILGSIIEHVMWAGLKEIKKTLDGYYKRNEHLIDGSGNYDKTFLKKTHNMSLRRRLGDAVLNRIVRANRGNDFFQSYFDDLKIAVCCYGDSVFRRKRGESWEIYRKRMLNFRDEKTRNFLVNRTGLDPIFLKVNEWVLKMDRFMEERVKEKYRGEGSALVEDADRLFKQLMKMKKQGVKS